MSDECGAALSFSEFPVCSYGDGRLHHVWVSLQREGVGGGGGAGPRSPAGHGESATVGLGVGAGSPCRANASVLEWDRVSHPNRTIS